MCCCMLFCFSYGIQKDIGHSTSGNVTERRHRKTFLKINTSIWRRVKISIQVLVHKTNRYLYLILFKEVLSFYFTVSNNWHKKKTHVHVHWNLVLFVGFFLKGVEMIFFKLLIIFIPVLFYCFSYSDLYRSFKTPWT